MTRSNEEKLTSIQNARYGKMIEAACDGEKGPTSHQVSNQTIESGKLKTQDVNK